LDKENFLIETAGGVSSAAVTESGVGSVACALTVEGNLAVSGTVNDRDLSVDGLKLDAIDHGAQINPGRFGPSIDGLVPAPGSGSGTRVLREDGSWVEQVTGGGSVPLTPLTPRDFGAKGDGQSDDSVAFDNFFKALADGGVGYIPGGTYRVPGLTLGKVVRSKLTLFGDGREATILDFEGVRGKMSAGGTVFYLDAAFEMRGIHWKRFETIVAVADGSATQWPRKMSRDLCGVAIRDCRFSEGFTPVVMRAVSGNFRVDDISFERNEVIDCTGGFWSDCIQQNRVYVRDNHIRLFADASITDTGFTLNGIRIGASYPKEETAQQANDCGDWFVTGNKVQGEAKQTAGSHWLALIRLISGSRVLVTNNQIGPASVPDYTGSGLNVNGLYAKLTHCLIEGNIFRDCSQSNARDGAAYLKFKGRSLGNSSDSHAWSYNCQVINNTFAMEKESKQSVSGISSTATNISILNNRFWGLSANGDDSRALVYTWGEATWHNVIIDGVYAVDCDYAKIIDILGAGDNGYIGRVFITGGQQSSVSTVTGVSVTSLVNGTMQNLVIDEVKIQGLPATVNNTNGVKIYFGSGDVLRSGSIRNCDFDDTVETGVWLIGSLNKIALMNNVLDDCNTAVKSVGMKGTIRARGNTGYADRN
jgi:hypothetical protein